MSEQSDLNEKHKLTVFISYSRGDSVLADDLVNSLEELSYNVLIDRRNLPYGEEWQVELSDLIQSCDVAIWMTSAASIKSKWCLWELTEIQKHSKKLVPIRIEGLSSTKLPETLRRIHILPSTGLFSLDSHLEDLSAALNENRDWVKEHSRLGDRARDWSKRNRSSALLLRGAALNHAEAWRQRVPRTEAPAEQILELIQASRQGATRRLRLWLVGACALFLAALSLSLFAIGQRNEAQTNLASAFLEKGQGLLRQKDLLSGRLLVAQSLLLDDTDEARRQLAESIDADPRVSRIYGPSVVKNSQTKCCLAIAVDAARERIYMGNSTGAIDWISEDGKSSRPNELDLGQGVTVLSVSPRGDLIAAGGENGAIKIWHITSGKLISSFEVDVRVIALEFHPTQPKLAVGKQGDGLSHIDLLNSRIEWEVSGHGQSTQGLTYSSDGAKLIWVGSEEWIWLADTATGQQRRLINGGKGWKYAVALSPNGQLLAFQVNRSEIQVVDMSTAAAFNLVAHQDAIQSLEFDPSSEFLLAADYEGSARIWDIQDRSVRLALPKFNSPIYSAHFVDGSNAVALAVQNYGVALYQTNFSRNDEFVVAPPPDLERALERFARENPGVTHPMQRGLSSGRYANSVAGLSFGSDQLYVATANKPLYVLGTSKWKPLRELDIRPGLRGEETFKVTKDRIVVSPDLLGREVEIWDLGSETATSRVIELQDCKVEALDLLESGEIAVGCQTGVLKILDDSGAVLKVLGDDQYGSARTISIDSDSGRIAVGYGNGRVRVWDHSDVLVKDIAAHQGTLELVRLRNGGQMLASAATDKQVKIWDLSGNSPVATFDVWARALAFSSDGLWLATGGEDRQVYVYNMRTLKLAAAVGSLVSDVASLAFSRDGKILASGDEAGRVSIFRFDRVLHAYLRSPQQLYDEARSAGAQFIEGFRVVQSMPIAAH